MGVLVAVSNKQGATRVLGTWLAFCLAVILALPQPPNIVNVAIGALLGALAVLAGFSAVEPVRPLDSRQSGTRVRFGLLSLAAGASLGAILLAVLLLATKVEPALRARFAGRATEPAWRPLALAFESSILEEVIFRLFILTATAWLVLRLSKRPAWAVSAGVATSTALFALAHLPAWSAAVATPTAMLIASVFLLNGVAALLFAWVFWRWGLPYAIFCHFAADMVVQTLAPRLIH